MFVNFMGQRRYIPFFEGDGGAAGGGGTGGGGSGAGGEEKKFTQAELDQHVQQRVSRAEKAAQKVLAKELGYESVEAMQAALKKPEGGAKSKEGEDKSLTSEDVDKRVQELLEAGQKEQNEKTFKRLLTAEVKVLANELGFADWEDAFALADLSEVKEDDKGNLTGVKEALEALGKKKPHLIKQLKKGGGTFGAEMPGGGTGGGKPNKEEIIKLAQSRGTVATQATYDPWARK